MWLNEMCGSYALIYDNFFPFIHTFFSPITVMDYYSKSVENRSTNRTMIYLIHFDYFFLQYNWTNPVILIKPKIKLNREEFCVFYWCYNEKNWCIRLFLSDDASFQTFQSSSNTLNLPISRGLLLKIVASRTALWGQYRFKSWYFLSIPPS